MVSLPTEVHLHDIGCIIRDHKDVDEQSRPPMLNIAKWSTLKNEALSALRFQDTIFEDPPENQQRQAELDTAMEYLRAGLLGVSTGEDYRQVLWTTSDRLRESEELLRTGHPPRL